MNGELWQNISALDQHLRRLDQVLGLTNQLAPRDPGRKARLERRQERRQAPRGSGPRQFDCGFEARSIHILFAIALFIAPNAPL
jgi:hypothetical protein